jgi:delta1-piperideine-2-carboxylate reductase
MSQGDVLLASKNNRKLASGMAVDADGNPTIDPNAFLQGGAFLPFGGHKGSAIAFMIEILSAAVTGGRFGFDDRAGSFPGAKTSHAGQLVIALDPLKTAGPDFFERVEELLSRLKSSGAARLPGDLRYSRRQRSEIEGISIPGERYDALMCLLR